MQWGICFVNLISGNRCATRRSEKKKSCVIRTVEWTLDEQVTPYAERTVWHYYRIRPFSTANNQLLGTNLCQSHPISISLRSILLSHSPPLLGPTGGRLQTYLLTVTLHDSHSCKHPAHAALPTSPPEQNCVIITGVQGSSSPHTLSSILVLTIFLTNWTFKIHTNFFVIKPIKCINFTNLFCHETLDV